MLKRDQAMARLLIEYGWVKGICNKDGRFILGLEDAKADDYLISEPPDADETAAQEPEAPDYLDTEAPPDLWWPGCDDTPLNLEWKSAMAADDYYAKLVTEQEHATKPDENENAMSVAAKKGASLAVEREPVVGLRAGHSCWSFGPAAVFVLW